MSTLVKGGDDGAQPSALFKLARVRTATWATAGGTFTKGGDFFSLQTLHAGRNMHIRMSGVFWRNFDEEQSIELLEGKLVHGDHEATSRIWQVE